MAAPHCDPTAHQSSTFKIPSNIPAGSSVTVLAQQWRSCSSRHSVNKLRAPSKQRTASWLIATAHAVAALFAAIDEYQTSDTPTLRSDRRRQG